MAPLDAIDKVLLEALQRNGRETHAGLARQVGLTPPAVLERVRKLEDRGVISGYTAVLDPAQLGFDLRVFIAVTLARHQENAIGAFLEAIAGFPQIVGHYHLTGRFDFLLQGVFPDVPALEQFIAHRLTALPVIDRAETFIILSGHHGRPLPIPASGEVREARKAK